MTDVGPMEDKPTVRSLTHEVLKCPRCGRPHAFLLSVRSKPVKVPLFGGTGSTPGIAFTCPDTQEIFVEVVPDPPDGEIIGLSDGTQPTAASAVASAPDADFAEWTKTSRSVAIDFCKTMITAASASIPLYFAVLKYVGVEAMTGSWFARLGLLPPALFLASTVVFAVGLRPRLAWIDERDFAAFRARRLVGLDRLIVAGLTLFALGAVVAIGLTFAALLPH
jgi:hypothetical protein